MSQTPGSTDAFNDSLSFVKKLWGGMQVPGMGATAMPNMPTLQGMAMPSMSLEDLDKRIQDLKTVEAWLNVNMTMLRSTIQALEVQRATIATLHSLSSSMADTMKGMSAGGTSNPFSGYMAQSGADSNAKAGATQQAAEKPTPADSPAPASSDGADTTQAGEVSPLISQSAAWWSGVQEQFKQALGTALEKSAANYEAVKSAGETVVKASTTQFKAASVKPKVAAKTAAKSASMVKKAGAVQQTAAKAVSKSPIKSTVKPKAAGIASSARKVVK
jgi:hypothetical protein